MKKRIVLGERVVAAAMVAGVGLMTRDAAAVTLYTGMRVANHVNVTTVPDATIVTAFQNATTALQVDNGANDQSCDLNLSRSDSYWFSGGGSTDIVNTAAQYTATQFNAALGYAVIVNNLNICAGVVGNWGGCGAPQNGDQPFLVTRTLFTAAQGGIVIAHEFGHTVGLGHDDSFARQIMSAAVLATNNNKSRTALNCQSGTWRTAHQAGGCTGGTAPRICSTTEPPIGFASSGPIQSTAPDQGGGHDFLSPVNFSNVPIEVLAQGYIVDSLPVEVEDYYGENDLLLLRDMIRNDKYATTHQTIATLIGLISSGSDEDVDVLVEYANGGDNVFAATMSLGYVVERTGNSNALAVLKSTFEKSKAGSKEADASALGLGLSGHQEALALLRSRDSSERNPAQKDLIATAIDQNTRVAELGTRGHYALRRANAVSLRPPVGGGSAGKN